MSKYYRYLQAFTGFTGTTIAAHYIGKTLDYREGVRASRDQEERDRRIQESLDSQNEMLKKFQNSSHKDITTDEKTSLDVVFNKVEADKKSVLDLINKPNFDGNSSEALDKLNKFIESSDKAFKK